MKLHALENFQTRNGQIYGLKNQVKANRSTESTDEFMANINGKKLLISLINYFKNATDIDVRTRIWMCLEPFNVSGPIFTVYDSRADVHQTIPNTSLSRSAHRRLCLTLFVTSSQIMERLEHRQSHSRTKRGMAPPTFFAIYHHINIYF